ncbi:hypothetical protein [Phocaeicola vulgatus]|uniref:hypothetical protein n=1 Tax=Phocaeicola vulgatus TaxID=821 RepID=UPI0035621334
MKMKARTKMKTLLLLGVLLFGFTVSAQSQKVSLDFKNERVEKVLASIKVSSINSIYPLVSDSRTL